MTAKLSWQEALGRFGKSTSHAYTEGFRSGWLDRFLGQYGHYLGTSFQTEPAYVQECSAGYNDGWKLQAKHGVKA